MLDLPQGKGFVVDDARLIFEVAAIYHKVIGKPGKEALHFVVVVTAVHLLTLLFLACAFWSSSAHVGLPALLLLLLLLQKK